VKLDKYAGIVALGDPMHCPIARFYYDDGTEAQPRCVLQSAWAAKDSTSLDAPELVALYHALALRIEYLRERVEMYSR